MQKINFEDKPSTNTPITADNLNDLQDNVEEAIDEVQGNLDTSNTYSTDETIIGKWINNKPVYRKVIIYNNTTSGSAVDINVSSLNADFLMINDKSYIDVGEAVIPVNFYRGDTYTYCYVTSPTNIRLYVAAPGWVNHDVYLVLEYTKTTDTVE